MVGGLGEGKLVKLAGAAGIPVLKGTERGNFEKGMSRPDSSPRKGEKMVHHCADASAGWAGQAGCQAVMCGFRGGTWNNGSTNERVSDRNNAANTNTNRNNNNGARFAKTTFL